MNKSIDLNDIFSKESITNRARENWNFKSSDERLRSGNKYKHLFNAEDNLTDWSNAFDGLSEKQRILLVKGELIRTYDALPNIDKTAIKEKFNLSIFSSKWFKLPSKDKTKLLKYVI